ncbi:MAG: 50S ribosomal protein L22 [Candidatus Aenigmarchaeota archaeon]|nr:50S ribosomal protein L22 [Candidatus Aenigmarchaeota archaeon]
MVKINHPHPANEERVARSGATNMRISTKNSVEISRFIKGLAVDRAIEYLEDVVIKKKAVPFKRFIKDQAHRKGGMGPGRYPVNAVIEFIKLLKNVKNNAEQKGFEAERLVVDNAQANLCGSSFHRGARSFGRRYSKSTNISITVKEKKVKKSAAEKAKTAAVEKKPKAVETKKTAEKPVAEKKPKVVEAKDKTEPKKTAEKPKTVKAPAKKAEAKK